MKTRKNVRGRGEQVRDTRAAGTVRRELMIEAATPPLWYHGGRRCRRRSRRYPRHGHGSRTKHQQCSPQSGGSTAVFVGRLHGGAVAKKNAYGRVPAAPRQ